MDKLNLPDYSFRIEHDRNKKTLIFDPVRKKKVLLTPEEWVRQNMIRFLVEDRNFPITLISVESLVKVNRLIRRFDVLVFNRKGETLLLIECKAPGVDICQDTFDQVIAYNHSLKAPYLLVTNGLKHYFCKFDDQEKKYIFMADIPLFTDL